MRRGVVTVIVLTALAAAVMPALAADEVTITASDFQFTPAQPTIHAGDTVRFANSEGLHNFAFADGASYPAVAERAGRRVEQPLADVHAGGRLRVRLRSSTLI